MEENKENGPFEDVPKESKQDRKQLQLRANGEIALSSLEDQFRFAQQLISQEMVSSTFKTPQQVVIGFQYAKAMRMNELLAMRKMYVIDGVPCLFGEGPLALVQQHKDFDKILEYFVDADGVLIHPNNKNIGSEVFGSVTEIWRKGDETAQVDWFTKKDLALAGMDLNKFGQKKAVWAKYERIMMRYKARALAMRTKFADALFGVAIAEHDFNVTMDEAGGVIGNGTSNGTEEEMNQKYLRRAESVESEQQH